MSIEIFEKALPSNHFDGQTIVDLLHDAGFTDVALDGSPISSYQKFTSASGVYGCNNFSMYASSTSIVGLTKFMAVKDESRKSLIVFCDATHTDTGSTTGDGGKEWAYFSLIIVDGTFISGAYKPFTNCSVTGGDIKGASDTSEAKLVPFMDSNGDTHEPFYVAMNRVNHTINTVVTDGSNSFTSLGNLFYIKNA